MGISAVAVPRAGTRLSSCTFTTLSGRIVKAVAVDENKANENNRKFYYQRVNSFHYSIPPFSVVPRFICRTMFYDKLQKKQILVFLEISLGKNRQFSDQHQPK